MNDADMIEDHMERLVYDLEGWLFAGRTVTPEIKEFHDWCMKDNKESLHCKRGGDGKSFYERRIEVSP